MQEEIEVVRREMEVRLVDEQRLRYDIEKKLQNLRNRSTSGNLANPDNSAIISALESARYDLDTTQVMVDAYKEVLASRAANVVNLWADTGFLESTHMTYIQSCGFEWLETVSEAAFYIFATLLCPKSDWDGQIRSNSCMRYMQQELRDYVRAEQENVGGSEADVAELNAIVHIFTSSCDVVQAGEVRMASMSVDGAQARLNEQDRLWSVAKQTVQTRFKLDSQPPLQHIHLLNDFTDTWGAQKEAEQRNLSAIAQVTSLVRKDASEVCGRGIHCALRGYYNCC